MPFDPGEKKDRTRPILRITRNEAFFDYSLAWSLIDNINSDSFAKADPHCVKVGSIKPSPAITDPVSQIRYYQVVYEFHFNPDGWKKSILSSGIEELKDGQLTAILDEKGQPVSTPQALDEDGAALPFGTAKDNAFYCKFDAYQEISFAAIFQFNNLDLGLGAGF